LRNIDLTHTGEMVLLPRGDFEMANAEAHTVRRWLIDTEARVQSQVTSWEIRGGRSGVGARFSPIPSVFPY
jgi:hypothetical protein